MNKNEIISQLKSLQQETKTHIDEQDENDIFRADFEALEEAINMEGLEDEGLERDN